MILYYDIIVPLCQTHLVKWVWQIELQSQGGDVDCIRMGPTQVEHVLEGFLYFFTKTDNDSLTI